MFCRNCGNKINNNELFCTKCGINLKEQIEHKKSKGNKLNIIIGLILTIIGIGITIGTFFFFGPFFGGPILLIGSILLFSGILYKLKKIIRLIISILISIILGVLNERKNFLFPLVCTSQTILLFFLCEFFKKRIFNLFSAILINLNAFIL